MPSCMKPPGTPIVAHCEDYQRRLAVLKTKLRHDATRWQKIGRLISPNAYARQLKRLSYVDVKTTSTSVDLGVTAKAAFNLGPTLAANLSATAKILVRTEQVEALATGCSR